MTNSKWTRYPKLKSFKKYGFFLSTKIDEQQQIDFLEYKIRKSFQLSIENESMWRVNVVISENITDINLTDFLGWLGLC